MVSAAYATCDKHALNVLEKLAAEQKIDPRQLDAIVAAAVDLYRKQRPTDIPVTDAIRAARRQGPPPETVGGGAVEVPALDTLEPIPY